MGFFINQRIMMAKLIRTMFYIQNPNVKLSINSTVSDVNVNLEQDEIDHLLNKLKSIKFKFFQIVKVRIRKTCRCSKIKEDKKTEEEVIYDKGTSKLKNELNILSILQTIQKMKATLSVIIKDDDKLIFDIKQRYFNNQSIYINDFQEHQWLSQKTEYQKFLDRDDRNALRFEREMRKKYLQKMQKRSMSINSPGFEEYIRKETVLYDSHFVEGFNRKVTLLGLPKARISDPDGFSKNLMRRETAEHRK